MSEANIIITAHKMIALYGVDAELVADGTAETHATVATFWNHLLGRELPARFASYRIWALAQNLTLERLILSHDCDPKI